MVTVATPAWWTSGKEVNNNKIKQTADKKSVNNTHVSIMHLQMKALCVIFTILVSFSRDNALFASKAKINVF